ncbi:MAG: hypothetical protein SPG65_04240 [Campylobacter sp.]|uniref:hypothetical protein n=1 Tax=Campylobacter sp. TaxID=205 RepID=UPI002A7550C8|nr:hypothetical protein [Campylobacter sp.]MDY3246577.1 hypothetical protein [Campylobacter sp.]MDY5384315.1 hypothetical protein [Campylobacter sp.]
MEHRSGAFAKVLCRVLEVHSTKRAPNKNCAKLLHKVLGCPSYESKKEPKS